MMWSHHLLIAPILLPLVTGALLLLLDERRHVLKSLINLAATFALAVIAIRLLAFADVDNAVPSVYLLGNWAAPFGIVLVLDRLSAMMLTLTAMLALASLVFALARWHRSGPHFHSLFQLLLMGLNGAFLTGDLFNLFVFFEVLLAASYGLVLHGSGIARVRAGMHYIAINLAGAALFLIGVSLIYGATGTLNMADLAARIATLADGDRALLEGGAAILGIAFLIKAGMWPLGLWLPATYTAAAAPVAAIFAILSKVGIYVILRLSLLLFGADAGASNGFGESWLLYGGLTTMAFGAFGVLASQAMGRLNGFYILVSSGTLLAAIGTANVGVISGALFYMVSSTLTISVFFLLVELVERAQDPAADVLAVTREAYGDEDEEEEEDEVGVAIPATLAILGLCFTGCGLLLAGMPPLSGFIGKFALLNALFGIGEQISSIPATIWLFAALLIFSGLSAMIAMMRAGIRTFWSPVEGVVPRVMLIEIVPVGFLLLLCVAMTVGGGPVMRYMDATAHALHAPSDYVHTVLGTRSVPRDKAGGH